jgi:hypothetical protein
MAKMITRKISKELLQRHGRNDIMEDIETRRTRENEMRKTWQQKIGKENYLKELRQERHGRNDDKEDF